VIRVRCPYCSSHVHLADILAETTVKCPRCPNFFDADPLPPVAAPECARPAPPVSAAPPPPPAGASPARLTSPHVCANAGCHTAINQPLGRRRDTIVCPACGRKTSIYAVLYRCPGCDALLESPLRKGGTTDVCPVCRVEVQVPEDVLLPIDDDPGEGDFSFGCAHCSREVRTRRDLAGRWAVCPGCQNVVRVPRGGFALTNNRSPYAGDPREVLEEATTWRCRFCYEEIPKKAVTCPYCGEATPTE
jgi:DNA-directed RNA polymerase subunit RPC12/RpoP